ncbi:unnamed protein product [Paramecium primaurelia]|uniref:Uncharacterized protein n=1 Tax=Paramecium primaurelia TaxID=5886 RepID=A0A8S1NK46_PARPR|nr:unnamed protein product [Paramecium primaurelia]
MVVCFLHTPLNLYCEEDNSNSKFNTCLERQLFIYFAYSDQVFLNISLRIKKLQNQKTQQEQKIHFQPNQEKYGIIDDWLTLINLFGYLFPFSIILVLDYNLISDLNVQVVIQNSETMVQRRCSFGIWNEVINQQYFVTVLCNSGLILSTVMGNCRMKQYSYFQPLLFHNFFVKYINMFMSLFCGTPTILEQIIRRGYYIYKQCINYKQCCCKVMLAEVKEQQIFCEVLIFTQIKLQK